jgi:hypothetical protein
MSGRPACLHSACLSHSEARRIVVQLEGYRHQARGVDCPLGNRCGRDVRERHVTQLDLAHSLGAVGDPLPVSHRL